MNSFHAMFHIMDTKTPKEASKYQKRVNQSSQRKTIPTWTSPCSIECCVFINYHALPYLTLNFVIHLDFKYLHHNWRAGVPYRNMDWKNICKLRRPNNLALYILTACTNLCKNDAWWGFNGGTWFNALFWSSSCQYVQASEWVTNLRVYRGSVSEPGYTGNNIHGK